MRTMRWLLLAVAMVGSLAGCVIDDQITEHESTSTEPPEQPTEVITNPDGSHTWETKIDLDRDREKEELRDAVRRARK